MSLGRDRCPTCGQKWLWETSGALSAVPGVVSAKHAPGPCVPIAAVPDDPFVVENDRRPHAESECRGCGVTYRRKRYSQHYCEPKCRVRHMATLRLILRVCPECEGEFRTVYRKQITCSERCRRRRIKKYRADYWLTVTKVA